MALSEDYRAACRSKKLLDVWEPVSEVRFTLPDWLGPLSEARQSPDLTSWFKPAQFPCTMC